MGQYRGHDAARRGRRYRRGRGSETTHESQMNRKQLITLIVLAAVIGGFGWYAYNKKQSSYERGSTSDEGQKLLKGVATARINDVAAVAIQQNTNHVTLTRTADGWAVKERGGYPANFSNISDLLKKLWELK